MFALLAFATTCIAAGAVSFALARHAARHRVAATVGVAALLLLLLARAVLAGRPDWEWSLLPWPAYAWIQRLMLYPIAAAFFGFATAQLPIAWNRAVVALVGFGVIGFGCHENAWLAWPRVHGAQVTAGADHHLQQTTHFTCGPAACVAAASRCGVTVTEREMAERCLTHAQGTRLFDLYRGLVLSLDTDRFEVAIRARTADELLAPGIVAVSSNRGGGHAICILGAGDHAIVHDPLRESPQRWSATELATNYRGPAIVIRRRTVDASR